MSCSKANAPIARAAHAIVRCARRVRLVGAATIVNAGAEHARLTAALRAGGRLLPQFEYAARTVADETHATLAWARTLLGAEKGPWAEILAGRAEEAMREATLCTHAGAPSFAVRARERYPRRDVHDAAADALAESWLREDGPVRAESGAETSAAPWSDDAGDRASLVSRMREEAARRGLAVRVVVAPTMAALAAVGEGVIYVRAGVRVARRDVERTVLHEIDGHALPEARSRAEPSGRFAAGSAFGSDDQEGRALLLEDRAGFLDAARRRTLALRHVAARSAQSGADFDTTARLLVGRGAAANEAVQIAMRVFRGGGLARESVYLPAYLRVSEALARTPSLEPILAAGRISVPAGSRVLALAPARSL